MESRSSHLDGVKAAICLPCCVKERGKREKERKKDTEQRRGRERQGGGDKWVSERDRRKESI